MNFLIRSPASVYDPKWKKKQKRTPKPNNETNLKFTIESLDLAQMDLNWNIAAYGTEPTYLVLG